MVDRNGGPLRLVLVGLITVLFLSSGCLSGVQEAPGATNESDDVTVNSVQAGQNDSENGANDSASGDEALPAVNTTADGLVGNSAVESPLSPKPFPERPERLTVNATEQYVVDYEVAYLRNDRLINATTDLEINPFDVSSRPTEDGGVVVTVRIGYAHYTGNAVGDGGYTVHYFVNETVVQHSFDSPNYRPGKGLPGGTTLERCAESCDG